MTAKFRSPQVLTGLLLMMIASLVLLAPQQRAAEAGPSSPSVATLIRDWELAQQEMALLYLSHPDLNPLEQSTLRDYSWLAREQMHRLRRTLLAAAYLVTNDESSHLYQKAVQTLTFPSLEDSLALEYYSGRKETGRQL